MRFKRDKGQYAYKRNPMKSIVEVTVEGKKYLSLYLYLLLADYYQIRGCGSNV
jgi:hypothetical protein